LSDSYITWRSPSNIAIVKYWGKKSGQIPQNPSLSFTLSKAYTETRLAYQPGSGQITFRFSGKENPPFAERIKNYLSSIRQYLPHLQQWDLTIDSENSFPHSAGIASSASSMSALVLGLVDMEQQLLGIHEDPDEFLNRASFLSRLASGSACRSVYPRAAIWGKLPDIRHSSDLYAVPVPELHSIFDQYQDTILIVHSGVKSVSSSAGHGLMENHPFAEARYAQARNNMTELLGALAQGDLEHFGIIAEEEAMTLHALMMCSRPGYTLMKPETLAWIEAVRTYRHETSHPLYFTLDAGPNLHLLYPADIAGPVRQWLEHQLSLRREDQTKVLFDAMGMGPEKIEV